MKSPSRRQSESRWIKNRNGAASLLSVIVLTVLIVLVVVSLALVTLGNLEFGFAKFKAGSAVLAAESCVEEALIRLARVSEANGAEADFVDDDQGDFDAGSYNETQWDGGNSWVELTSAGQTAGTGTFTSEIEDAGSDVSWDSFSWVPTAPYGKELPNGSGGSSGWWDSSYAYRKKITFGTNHSSLPDDFTVSVQMDTQTASTNVALASGNDVRIVWDPSSGSDVELDRIGDSWNSSSTNIDFRLQSAVSANADEDADGSYYIYYGYASAGSPPTDEADVYYFADFFDRSDSSTVGNGWTEWNDGGGDLSISGGALHSAGNNANPPDAGIKQNFPLGAITSDFTIEFDWTMPSNPEGIWAHYVNIGSSSTMSNSSRTAGVGPGIYNGEGSFFSPDNTENISNDLSGDMETNINGGPHTIRMEVDYSANDYDYYRNDTLRASNQNFVNASVTLDQIRIVNDNYVNTATDFVYDDLKITLDVSNDPEESAGSEESYSAGSAGVETAYSEGNMDMTDATMLFHLNESSGTLADDAGNGYDATANGGVTYGTTGRLNDALTFNGSSGYISTTKDLNTDLGGTATVAFWVRTTQTGSDTMWQAPGITGVEQSGGGNDIFWGWIDASGNIGVMAGNDGGASSTTAINDGTWHHVALTRNASNGAVEVFVDGVSEDSGTTETGVKSTSFYSIGRIEDTGGTPEYFEGDLDEFVAFDSILSDAEIESIYLRGAVNIKFQMRSCDDNVCDGESFIGPDGTSGTYFEEINNSSVSLPSFSTSALSDNRYIQYQATFETLDASYSPTLASDSIVESNPNGQTVGDNSQSDFDAGSYNETQWDGGNAWVELTSAGQSSGSGTFDSQVFNGGSSTDWKKIAWVPGGPYGKELPSSSGAPSGWWDSSYGYRKRITFGTDHSALPDDFTVSVQMDTQTASTNVALASGNDVRIVWDPSSGSDVELDRIGDTWNNSATNIEFRLQSAISVNADEDSDGSYYIYYGNASAGSPPTDEADVYYFADFFDRSDSSTVGNGWTEWNDGGGDVAVASGELSVGGANTGPPDAGVSQSFPLGAITDDFTLEFDWTLPSNSEGIWTQYVNIGSSSTMTSSSRTTGVGPGIYAGEGSHFSPNNTENISNDLSGDMETNINGGPYSIRMEVDYSANTYDYYRNDTLRASGQNFVNASVTLDQIRFVTDQYDVGAGGPFLYDNMKIMLDVSNNPEESAGSEESYSSGSIGIETDYPAGNADMTGNILLYHLNEASGTLSDDSGNGNDGTGNGITYGATGKLDDAVAFNGTTDYIQTPSSDLKTASNFTLSAWFKTDSSSTVQHIFWEGPASENGWGNGSDSSSHEMHLSVNKFDATDIITFFYGYEDPSSGFTPAVEIQAPFSDTTSWHHAAVVMTGAGSSPSAELFLDGVSVGTDTGTQTDRSNWDTDLRIGRPGTGERYFDGTMDELAVWTRALDGDEVAALYERGALRLRFRARTCDDAACSGESFVGPDGTGSSYYDEVNNSTVDLPIFNLSGIDNQYVQYRAYFETDDSSLSPNMTEVRISEDPSGGSLSSGGGGSASYTGGNLTVGDAQCTITVTGSDCGSCTVDVEAVSGQFTRNIRTGVTVTSGSVDITSWEEID